jgi:hypothetical protein
MVETGDVNQDFLNANLECAHMLVLFFWPVGTILSPSAVTVTGHPRPEMIGAPCTPPVYSHSHQQSSMKSEASQSAGRTNCSNLDRPIDNILARVLLFTSLAIKRAARRYSSKIRDTDPKQNRASDHRPSRSRPTFFKKDSIPLTVWPHRDVPRGPRARFTHWSTCAVL